MYRNWLQQRQIIDIPAAVAVTEGKGHLLRLSGWAACCDAGLLSATTIIDSAA